MFLLLGLFIFLAILVLSTLVPCQAERPARKPPYVTWGLIGVNIFVFLTSIFVSNVSIPSDRIYGKEAIRTVLQEHLPQMSESEREAFELRIEPSGSGQEALVKSLSDTLNKTLALKYASQKIESKEDLTRLFQIEHSDSTYVLEPHYSVLNTFAYRPAEPYIPGKILGLIGSMFLHGSFSHLIFNMIYLFVFGRALEDALGPRTYIGAYLLCGIAAALLHHIMGMFLTPDSMALPYLGASGAIGGVLGLFALRFYRTTTSIFLAFPLFFLAGFLYLMSMLLTGNISLLLTNLMSGNDTSLETIYAFLVVLAFVAFGPARLKPTVKIASAWAVGLWVVVFNLLPIVQQVITKTSDGTAYWAHIGGFLLGSVYGLLIGSKEEGKHEFMLEDAEKAYNIGDIEGAISYSQNVLEREPGNGSAYAVMGKAWMKQNNEEEALNNFEIAIENYLRAGEPEKAVETYGIAIEKYPLYILKPSVQLVVGSQMAREHHYKLAAETLVKIPYTYPDAPEGEVAFLRSAQIYLQQLDQPQTAVQLLQHFWQKYPESQWMPQVERTWKMAQHQLTLAAERLAAEQEAQAAAMGPSETPSARPVKIKKAN